MPPIPGFCGPSNVAQSLIFDAERTVNMYFELATSPNATAQYALYTIPGVQLISSAASGKGRAHIFIGGREFAVIGTSFIEVDQYGVQTVRGSVADDGEPATISSNGDGGLQLFITAGGNGYSYDLQTNTLAAIAALAGIATMGASMDGFGLCLDADSSTVYISELNDFTTWDPTQFIQRSQAPDPWVSMKVSNKYLYLFGSQTSEPWYNAGTSPIPFQPTATVMNYGCGAPWSPTVVGDGVNWIGASVNGDNMVLRAEGLTPTVISTPSTEYAFDSMPQTFDAIGDSYDDRGHTFYVLTFPFANQTWVWDETVPVWCERGEWDEHSGSYDIWKPLYHAFAFGEHRFLDPDGTSLYRTKDTIYTQADGNGIRWLRTSPTLINENQRQYFSTFELFIEVGLGLTTGQGSNPQVALRISNDGGKTYGAPQFRTFGAIGTYDTRVRWTRCGSGRKRVFQVYGSDPVPARIMGAWLEL